MPISSSADFPVLDSIPEGRRVHVTARENKIVSILRSNVVKGEDG